MKKISIGVLLAVTSTYTLADETKIRSIYKTTFNTKTNQIKIIEKTNPTKTCDDLVANERMKKRLKEKNKNIDKTIIYETITCVSKPSH